MISNGRTLSVHSGFMPRRGIVTDLRKDVFLDG